MFVSGELGAIHYLVVDFQSPRGYSRAMHDPAEFFSGLGETTVNRAKPGFF